MSITNISWLFCGLFAFTTLIGSAITVHPSFQRTMNMLIGGAATASWAFGIFAISFKRRKIAESKRLILAFLCIAVLTTILCIFIHGG
jgi:hypothetical protein